MLDPIDGIDKLEPIDGIDIYYAIIKTYKTQGI